MATKTTTKKIQTKRTATKADTEKKAEKTMPYYYGVGRRKTAVAQVRLYHSGTDKSQEGIVNNRPMEKYFGTSTLRSRALAPLKNLGLEGAFRITVVVRGSGPHSQADAVALGVARALLLADPAHRSLLKARGCLTRDARAVERKKAGLKKARRAPQWSKR